jgi:hypothetical protein
VVLITVVLLTVVPLTVVPLTNSTVELLQDMDMALHSSITSLLQVAILV